MLPISNLAMLESRNGFQNYNLSNAGYIKKEEYTMIIKQYLEKRLLPFGQNAFGQAHHLKP